MPLTVPPMHPPLPRVQPAPNNLKHYYTAYPAPISVIQYLDALFTCEVSA